MRRRERDDEVVIVIRAGPRGALVARVVDNKGAEIMGVAECFSMLSDRNVTLFVTSDREDALKQVISKAAGKGKSPLRASSCGKTCIERSS